MLRLAYASLWHWTQRTDCTDSNLSIGYWQLSRIHALLGNADNARKSADLCLEKTPSDTPFLFGYAHEALARAESLAGQDAQAKAHLATAWRHAKNVTDADDRQTLVNDLNTFE